MEPINARNATPLSPSAILAHLRQHPKANIVKTQKISFQSTEQLETSPEPPQITNIEPKIEEMYINPNSPIEECVYKEQDQGVVQTVKLPGSILKNPTKSIILRIQEKSNSPPSLDRKSLDDRLTRIKADTTNQSAEKNSFRVTKRSHVITLPCSLDGSRPSSRGNTPSIGNIYISPKNKKNKKVTFSVGTKDFGIIQDSPLAIKRSHIPLFEDFLKDENINVASLELNTIPKPPSRSSSRTPITRSSERKQQGSLFNISIKHRVLRDSDQQKTSLNNPNIDLMSEVRDSTPSGRSCTPKKVEAPPALRLSNGLFNLSKPIEDLSQFVTPNGGSLSARNSFNVNILNVANSKNPLMTERTTPRNSQRSLGKFIETNFNFYSELQQQKQRLLAVNSPCRNSVQPDGRISEFVIPKKGNRKSFFTSTERLSIINALKTREVKPYP